MYICDERYKRACTRPPRAQVHWLHFESSISSRVCSDESDKLGIRAYVIKVVSGIQKSHQFTSSKVLIISVSRYTYMGERL